MELQQAYAVLQTCSAYMGDGPQKDEIILDGQFTLEQLKALVLVIETHGVCFQIPESA